MASIESGHGKRKVWLVTWARQPGSFASWERMLHCAQAGMHRHGCVQPQG